MARVAIRIDDDKKDEWKQAVEETRQYSSLTQLIRLAVHKELSDSFGIADASDGSQATVEYEPEVSNAELYDRQRDVMSVLKNIRGTVNSLEAETDTVDSTSMIHVYQRLPKGSGSAVTPYQMADSMEMMSAELAEEVLERLEDRSGRVQTTTVADETHYYKDE